MGRPNDFGNEWSLRLTVKGAPHKPLTQGIKFFPTGTRIPNPDTAVHEPWTWQMVGVHIHTSGVEIYQ